jgi:hypothetical protein
MLRRFGFCATAFGISLFSASWSDAQQAVPARRIPSQAAPPQPAAPQLAEPSSSREAGQMLSPLHAFLGIDPVTGEFKPRNGSLRPAEPSRSNRAPGNGAPPAVSVPAGSDASSTEFQIEESTLDEFRAALTKAIDERDDEALASTLANLTRGVGYDQLSLVSTRFERLGYLALFLYPLGIVLSEVYGVWSRRHTPARNERDRRYYARQRRRRFALAVCSTTTIGLLWWAGEHRFWWNDPERLVPVMALLALLFLVSGGLRLVIARAARDYPIRVIEDLRLQQFALENEIKELRRRLQGDPIVDAV